MADVSRIYWDATTPAPTTPVIFTDGIYCLTKSVAWVANDLQRRLPDGTLVNVIPTGATAYVAPLYLPAGAYVISNTAATVGEVARIAIRVH